MLTCVKEKLSIHEQMISKCIKWYVAYKCVLH